MSYILTPYVYEPLLRLSEDVAKLKELIDDAILDARTNPFGTLQVIFVGETHRTRDELRRNEVLQYALQRKDVLILLERGMVQGSLKSACSESDLVAIEPNREELSSGSDTRNDLAFTLAMDLLHQEATKKKALLIFFGEDHEKKIRQRFIVYVSTGKIKRHVEWHFYPTAAELLAKGPRAGSLSATHTLVGYTTITSDDAAEFFLFPTMPLRKTLVLGLSDKATAANTIGLVVGVYIKKSEAALIQDIAAYVPNADYALGVENGLKSYDSDRVATAYVRLALD